MDAETVMLELSREEAEVLIGVLAAERHNEEAEAVCESIKRRLDGELAKLG
ncbi:MAG: hypothetical protein AB7V58_10600 [Solirubrobacterales bacterium]